MAVDTLKEIIHKQLSQDKNFPVYMDQRFGDLRRLGCFHFRLE